MPLTPAERQRKRRQKLKDEGTYEQYRNHHVILPRKAVTKRRNS